MKNILTTDNTNLHEKSIVNTNYHELNMNSLIKFVMLKGV